MRKIIKFDTKVLIEAIVVASTEREKRVYPNYLFLLEKKPELQDWCKHNRLIVSASDIVGAAKIAYKTPFYGDGERDVEWTDEDTYNWEILGRTQKNTGVIMFEGSD